MVSIDDHQAGFWSEFNHTLKVFDEVVVRVRCVTFTKSFPIALGTAGCCAETGNALHMLFSTSAFTPVSLNQSKNACLACM